MTVREQAEQFEWTAGSPGVAARANREVGPSNGNCQVTLAVHFEGIPDGLVETFTGSLTDRFLYHEADGLGKRSESIA